MPINFRQIKEDRRLLAARFPNCFAQPGGGHQKRPLKIAIHLDLFAVGVIDDAGQPVPVWRLRRALNDYCWGVKYALALIHCDERINLDGQPCGFVNEDTREEARQRIAKHGWCLPQMTAMAAE